MEEFLILLYFSGLKFCSAIFVGFIGFFTYLRTQKSEEEKVPVQSIQTHTCQLFLFNQNFLIFFKKKEQYSSCVPFFVIIC